MASTPTEFATSVQNQLDAPMPWIGMYVAAASILCTLAMAADSMHGFWSKKYWFPTKYFSLDATSLTLLAVVMKLPADLTTRMYAVTDRLAKVSSLVFMSTAMANFLPSMGSLDDNDILMNVAALGILVISITVNICIQVAEVHSFLNGRLAFVEEIIAICSMVLLLVIFASSALMIPSTKRYLEKKYNKLNRLALDQEQEEMERVSVDKLRVLIKKYWLMAETSSPQFVIARSVTSITSGVLCLIIALVLVEAEIRMAMEYNILDLSVSSYGWSTKWVLLTQSIGVVVGTISPAMRLFVAIKFRSTDEGRKSMNSSFTVEAYWTQKMVEWRRTSLSFQIRHLRSRKYLHHLRGLLVKLCIFVQCLIVMAGKLILLISVCIAIPFISCINYIRKSRRQNLISHSASSHDQKVSDSTPNPEFEIRSYVLLLDGEPWLPAKTLDKICKEVDKFIQKGRMQKPQNLLKLLQRSCNFNGVTQFDSHKVPSMHLQDVPYCWSLPVVTLTSIALALPNVEKQKSISLQSSVTEGLCFVKLIDQTLDKKGVLASVITAADVVWVEVELYHKWQDKDLRETSLKGKNAEEILQQLCSKAEKVVVEFTRGARDCLSKDPNNWPTEVITADAMYRISRTILVTHGGESDKTDEDLFEQLLVMIADIQAACLVNLAHVITKKCRHNAIEKREKSVREAARLLGETEEIIALLQQRELPFSGADKGASIEEWRASINLDNKI